MYLAYMDEAGNTGTKADPQQPIHMLGCLLVEDTAVRDLEDAISDVAAKHFKVLSKASNFEFHGAHMFGGKGIFRGYAPDKRIAAMKDLAEVIVKYASAYGYTGVDKLKSYANDHPHRIAFTLMVERLELWLKHHEALGLIVADENNEVGARLISDMEWFKQHSTTWGYVQAKLDRVIDSLHFVRSHDNRLIQACDVFTFMRLKNYLLRRVQTETFLKIPREGRPTFTAWIEATAKPGEKATMEVGRVMDQLSCFRAKVWPE